MAVRKEMFRRRWTTSSSCYHISGGWESGSEASAIVQQPISILFVTYEALHVEIEAQLKGQRSFVLFFVSYPFVPVVDEMRILAFLLGNLFALTMYPKFLVEPKYSVALA
jgi:hypothetical protein